MDAAGLVKDARRRHGLSQERLARRARTTQAAISRIERGEEAVTWSRLAGLLAAVGEEPVVTSRPIDHHGESFDLLDTRKTSAEQRLTSALASNMNVSDLVLAVAKGHPDRAMAARLDVTERLDSVALLETLAEFRVEHVVIGGVAVQAYGSPRLTHDLDLIPRPDLANFARLAEALAELEAVWRKSRRPLPLTDPHRLARADQLTLRTKFGKLDVMSAGFAHQGSYEDLDDRATTIPLGNITVSVAGIDDLIRMKRSAGRPLDLHDIATLTRPDADLERAADEAERRLRAQLEPDEPA